MGKLKRIAFSLAFILLCASIICIFFWDNVAQWIYVTRLGYGEREYIQIAVDTDGSMCAAYWKSPNQIALRFFDAEGKNVRDWVPALPEDAENGYLAALYPADNETAFLVFYEQNSTYLSVYRAKKGGTAERLLHDEVISPTALMTRRDSYRFGTFSRQQDEIRFTVIETSYRFEEAADGSQEDVNTAKITGYACSAAGGGLRKLTEQEVLAGEDVFNLAQAVVLPSGGLATYANNQLVIDGTILRTDLSDKHITLLAVSGSSLYYLDSASGTVYYTDLSGMRVQEVLQTRRSSDALTLTDLVLTPSGDVLLLEDGWSLTRLSPGGASSLSHALNPSVFQSTVIIAGIILGAVIVALLLGHVFFFMYRGSVSLALYWSFVIVSIGMALGVYLHYGVMLPDARVDRAERIDAIVRKVAGSEENVSGYENDWGMIYRSINVESLEKEQLPSIRAVDQIVAIWSEEKQGYFTWNGEPAGLIEGFSADLADRARLAQTYVNQYSQTRYSNAVAKDNVTVTFWMATDTSKPEEAVEPYVLTALGALVLAIIVVLIVISHSLRVLGRGLERYSRQEPWSRLIMETGDELEGIASSLNSMAADREMQERNRNRMIESYHRFVPEHVLALLERQSILDVDKSTFASREMAMLMVRFLFPESVYSVSSNSRLLFDSVNAVIERTAPIATRQGGTVFNFAINGYDVVMENNPVMAISMAVALQQEVLAFNESRAREGLPTVEFRIALDVGNVNLGIVGDSAQMQPTAISSGFTTALELIALSEQLDARILCTEAIAPGLQQYGSRFIGKRKMKNDLLRVYEIFDGDPYEMRKGKEATLSRFSQAVMAFYSGDSVQAKRIFLELAHETPTDGAARHYLYLADRMDGGAADPETFGL